jgi:predicted nucleic acid-binding protein
MVKRVKKPILDTSVLIRHWRRRAAQTRRRLTLQDAAAWAAQLIEIYNSPNIVTPVQIEFLAGAASAEELRLFRRFLAAFSVLDEENMPALDWQEARRLAQRVPRDGKPRQLGDCLIRAIANRLRCTVITHDAGFP